MHYYWMDFWTGFGQLVPDMFDMGTIAAALMWVAVVAIVIVGMGLLIERMARKA